LPLEIYAIQSAVDQLIERRISGAEDVTRIRGEEEIHELEEYNENGNQTTIDSFLGGKNE